MNGGGFGVEPYTPPTLSFTHIKTMWNKRYECIILLKERSEKIGKESFYQSNHTGTGKFNWRSFVSEILNFLSPWYYSAMYLVFLGPEIFALVVFLNLHISLLTYWLFIYDFLCPGHLVAHPCLESYFGKRHFNFTIYGLNFLWSIIKLQVTPDLISRL